MTQQSTKLLLVTFLSITAGTPATAADQPINFQKPDMDLINREIIKATNAARARHGLPALGNSKHLTYAAQLHTNDMVNQNFFDHNNPHDASKRTPEQRIAMSGYKAGATAENIAGSFGIKYEAGASVSFGGPGVIKLNGVEIPPHSPRSLAESLVTQWMNSPGHRANILSQGVTEMGSGVTFYVNKDFNSIIGVKACQAFGSPMT